MMLIFLKDLQTVLARDFVLLLDGAPYHTGNDLKRWLAALGVRVIYSGPYSFDAAPCEKVFAFLKRGYFLTERERLT